jgi:hypothetical protein
LFFNAEALGSAGAIGRDREWTPKAYKEREIPTLQSSASQVPRYVRNVVTVIWR